MAVAAQANALLLVADLLGESGPLGISSVDAATTDLLQGLINRASDMVEVYCGRKLKKRAFTNQRLARQFDPNLRPFATPISVADAITLTFDGITQTVWRTEGDGDRTAFDVVVGSDEPGEPSYLRRSGGWWSSDDQPILLSYTGGFATIPGNIYQAAILTVQAFYRQHKGSEGPYQSYPASATGGTVVMRTDTLPKTAEYLLDPYVFVRV